MLVRDLDRWLDERGLVMDVEAPFYTVIFYPPAGRTAVQAGGVTLTDAVASAIRQADIRQRQEGERWALRENPAFYVSTEAVDEAMAEQGTFLAVSAGAPPERYAAYTVARDGTSSRAIFGPSLENVLGTIAVAPPPPVRLQELEAEYEQLAGVPFGSSEAQEVHRAVELVEALGAAEASRQTGVPITTLKDWAKSGGPVRGGYSPELVQAVRALAAERGSVLAAKQFGIPARTIRDWMKQAGIKGGSSRFFAEEQKRAAIARAEQVGPKQAARELGISATTIGKWQAGIGRRYQPGPALTYAEVAPLVEELGSAAAAAAHLGRDPDEVAEVYYRGERIVQRVRQAEQQALRRRRQLA